MNCTKPPKGACFFTGFFQKFVKKIFKTLNLLLPTLLVKFIFSNKATKIDEIFTVDLTLCSKCQIDSEDFVDFCGLLRKYKLYGSNGHILQPPFCTVANRSAVGSFFF